MTSTLTPDELRHWLALLRCPRVGPVTFTGMLEHFGSAQQLYRSPATELQACGLEATTIDAILNPDWHAVDNDINWLQQQHNHHIVTVRDDCYPEQLRQSAAAPPLLFVSGQPAVLNRQQLAMVGSRNPSADGKHNAFEFARYLASAGLVITSGLAIGIDGICHRGALHACGSTIAVTGTGPDRIYPARNRDLALAIVDNGAIVTEFPVGTAPRPEHFPRRNRIISALSLGTLVVEAAIRSGSLITARYALEQGREVFAIPGSIHNPLTRGCHYLIQQGAKLVETAADIIGELPPLQQQPAGQAQASNIYREKAANDGPDYRLLKREMGFSPVAVDEIVDRTGLTAEAVSSMMLILELQGEVASMPGGCYIRVKKRGSQ